MSAEWNRIGVGDREAKTRADVDQAGHQPRIDRAEHELGERRARTEQHSGGDTGLHGFETYTGR